VLKPPTRDRVRATETLGSICMRTYQPGNGRLEEEAAVLLLLLLLLEEEKYLLDEWVFGSIDRSIRDGDGSMWVCIPLFIYIYKGN